MSGNTMRGNTILLVDDDALPLDLLSAQLNNLGHQEIAIAGSGLVALDHFGRLGAQIGVIFCDLDMPLSSTLPTSFSASRRSLSQ